jgi:hypothetical protein
VFCLGFVEFTPRGKDGYSREERYYANDSRERIGFTLDPLPGRLSRNGTNTRWRHVEDDLHAEQEEPEHNQSDSVELTELHRNSREARFANWERRGGFARTSPSGGGCATAEEMEKEHNYANHQQDVNEAAGNVKGQKAEQPENDQNCR